MRSEKTQFQKENIPMAFSLERFESYAYSRNREMGMRELISLLTDLDNNYGHLGANFRAQPLRAVQQEDIDQHVWTRTAAAASSLLADSELFIAPDWQLRMMTYHRWLQTLFAASPFQNADHVMRALNQGEGKEDLNQLKISQKDLLKFCLLYSPESEVALDLDALWEQDKNLAASLCLVLLSPRFLGSPSAHSKREQILPWLASRLDQIDDIEFLPVGVMHDLYMHCSYADRADKHDIKKPINELIRRKLRQQGLKDRALHETAMPSVNGVDKPAGKPVMIVLHEWFTSSHSMYRTHSTTIEAARELFYVIGVGYEQCLDDTTRQIFDETIGIPNNASIIDQLKQIQREARKFKAAILYMPSVGMFPLTMWQANLRIAPMQVMGTGHPATSYAHAIDYLVVEEDFIGDEKCFSEEMIKLPRDGLPYRPSASTVAIKPTRLPLKKPEKIEIAVCATTMKLNPQFLSACARIVGQTKTPIHFHFLVGQAQGLIYPNVKRVVRMFLSDYATIYPHQEYKSYMQVIADCDLFINPFPFGNTNGIIDCITAGLVGICKTGREVHEHIDEALFNRLGMPDWMIAKTVDEYVDATVRLANNHDERHSLRQLMSGPNKVELFFKGRI
jgi:HMW1 domain 2/HMW1C N-terminal